MARRLDFTVIGPSANVVTRLQDLCKALDTPIIASAEFAETCRSELVSLGKHDLRGMQGGAEVFTPPELTGG